MTNGIGYPFEAPSKQTNQNIRVNICATYPPHRDAGIIIESRVCACAGLDGGVAAMTELFPRTSFLLEEPQSPILAKSGGQCAKLHELKGFLAKALARYDVYRYSTHARRR